MDIFIKKIIKPHRAALFGVFLLFLGSCNKAEPDIYYGYSLTYSDHFYPVAQHYQIPQPSTLLTVQNNGSNYNVDLILMLTGYSVFRISATNVNLNTYAFTDSAITTNANYFMVGFQENNYASQRYTLAEGNIHFLAIDTNNLHCTFDYKFKYRDTTVSEPYYTNTIEITNAEVRIKK